MVDQSYFIKKMAEKLEFMKDDWGKGDNIIKTFYNLITYQLTTTVLCAAKKMIISIVMPKIGNLK